MIFGKRSVSTTGCQMMVHDESLIAAKISVVSIGKRGVWSVVLTTNQSYVWIHSSFNCFEANSNPRVTSGPFDQTIRRIMIEKNLRWNGLVKWRQWSRSSSPAPMRWVTLLWQMKGSFFLWCKVNVNVGIYSKTTASSAKTPGVRSNHSFIHCRWRSTWRSTARGGCLIIHTLRCSSPDLFLSDMTWIKVAEAFRELKAELSNNGGLANGFLKPRIAIQMEGTERRSTTRPRSCPPILFSSSIRRSRSQPHLRLDKPKGLLYSSSQSFFYQLL